MASSALYRYFPSRDDLLTALIVDAYNAIGAAAEEADATCKREDLAGRWTAATRSIRHWALANPNEYALVYGSPIPGYHAPTQVTEPPATRVTAVLAAILTDAAAAGPLELASAPPTLPSSLDIDFARLRAALMPGVPDQAIFRGVIAWLSLFGIVSFEVFGHLVGVVGDTDAFFDAAARDIGRSVGLATSRPGP
jgi:AcrR family transcriptional regulator